MKHAVAVIENLMTRLQHRNARALAPWARATGLPGAQALAAAAALQPC